MQTRRTSRPKTALTFPIGAPNSGCFPVNAAADLFMLVRRLILVLATKASLLADSLSNAFCSLRFSMPETSVANDPAAKRKTIRRRTIDLLILVILSEFWSVTLLWTVLSSSFLRLRPSRCQIPRTRCKHIALYPLLGREVRLARPSSTPFPQNRSIARTGPFTRSLANWKTDKGPRNVNHT